MNTTKIAALKQVLDAAQAAYVAEQSKLVAAGLKSAQRYEQLKPLKAAVDAANAEYTKFARGQAYKQFDAAMAASRKA